MKQIPPAIQENSRYLSFGIHGEKKELGEVVEAVWNSALDYMGTKGVSDAKIWIIGNKFNRKKQEGIIKVKENKEDDLRAALTINNGFEDKSFIKVKKTSGTLNSLENC